MLSKGDKESAKYCYDKLSKQINELNYDIDADVKEMIKKAGILEMIPLKESIEDIGGLENLKEWFIRKAKVYKNMKKAK